MFDNIQFSLRLEGEGGGIGKMLNSESDRLSAERWQYSPSGMPDNKFRLENLGFRPYSELCSVALDLDAFTGYVGGATFTNAHVDFKFDALNMEQTFKILKKSCGMFEYFRLILGSVADGYGAPSRMCLRELQYIDSIFSKDAVAEAWRNEFSSKKPIIDPNPFFTGHFTGFRFLLDTTDIAELTQYFYLIVNYAYNARNIHSKVKTIDKNFKNSLKAFIHLTGGNGDDFKAMRKCLYKRVDSNYMKNANI